MQRDNQWPKKKNQGTKPKTTGEDRMKKNKSGDSKMASNPKLQDVIKHRDSLTRGSKEWARAQNYINRSLGSNVKHDTGNALTEKQMRIAKTQKSEVLASIQESFGISNSKPKKKNKSMKYTGGM